MSNLPPREPPDLRNRGQGQNPQGQNPQGQRPSQSNQYPPPSGQYPPQQGGTGPLGGSQQPGQLGKRSTQLDGDLGRSQAPKLGARGSGGGDVLHERRIEYLAWGSVVLIVGCSIILLAIDTDAAANMLEIVTPLLAGGILLASGMVQRIFFGYRVSLVTWGAAIVATAFGSMGLISVLIEEATDSEPPISTRLIVFIGLLVIITGLVIILQVFRNPNEA
jgi:hypothetical protein